MMDHELIELPSEQKAAMIKEVQDYVALQRNKGIDFTLKEQHSALHTLVETALSMAGAL
ncbi:hypothetical protein H1R20_g11451, partial [Candolleomyces eurysporus]